MEKIVFVAGLHGNEQMPVRALRDKKIDFVFGNPKAYEEKVRFTEQDINASFGIEGHGYEVKLAKEILDVIGDDVVVVDFHTTHGETRPFAIVVDEKMIPLAQKTGLRDVVLMKHNIKKGHALINYRNGISIEAGSHDDRASYDTTLQVVENLKQGKTNPVAVYEVYGVIDKPGQYKNFEEHEDGFIPVLANEPEYEREGIYGLKAKKLTTS